MNKAKQRLRRGYKFASFAGAPAATCRTHENRGSISVMLVSSIIGDSVATATVNNGDTVKAGDVVATFADSIGAPIHSPVSGTIESVKKSKITILPTGNDEATRIDGATEQWQDLSADKLREFIYLSGAANLGAHGIPTEWGSAKIGPGDVTGVIVSLIDDDMLDPDPMILLDTLRLDPFVEGVKILEAAFPEATVTIAISGGYLPVASRLETGITGTNIQIVQVGAKYPQSHEAILVESVTGAAYPYGVDAIHSGFVMLDAQAPVHVSDAVTKGLPVTYRRVALGGPYMEEPGHIDVAIGTPVAEVISVSDDNEHETRTVMDSLMVGSSADDDTVISIGTKAIFCIPEIRSTELLPFATPGFKKDSFTNTFVAKFLPSAIIPLKKVVDANIHGEQRACLNCSYCADVCPVNIMPNLIHRYVERDLVSESLPRFGIMKCIDCNLCSYVCPSKIPLAQLMKQGKQELLEEGYVTEDYMTKDFSLKGLD